MITKVKPEDFIIQVRPFIDPKTKNWNGIITLNIISSDKTPLNKKEETDNRHICQMMCSVIPLTEENPQCSDLLDTFLQKTDKDFGNQDNKKDKKRLTNIERDGNIIRLNFKTEENAK